MSRYRDGYLVPATPIDVVIRLTALSLHPNSFYCAAALLAMQSAVITTAIPSVGLSVSPSRDTLVAWYTLSGRMKIGSRGLYYEVSKTL